MLELVVVLVLLAIMGATFLSRILPSTRARNAHVEQVLTAMELGHSTIVSTWHVLGRPGAGSTTTATAVIDNITVQFRNGQPIGATNSNHILPTTVPNRNTQQARLFYLFLQPVPTPIVATNSTITGWAMLGTNNTCASTALVGANPRFCWEYRVKGRRYARLSYSAVTGRFVRD